MRLLALAALGAFCVVELTEILGQSQPRLSRHLRLLRDAGLLDYTREGAHVWLSLPQGSSGNLVRELIARLPQDDPTLEADRRMAARVLAERARIASDSFRRRGADWDEMHALGLPVAAVDAAILALLPARCGRLIDIGTGTGGTLELLAPRIDRGVGIDASRAMLALARSRLARLSLTHCMVRQGDMYRLPFADNSFDTAVMQMVLHYAEDPENALTEASRVLRPGGRLVLVELAAHTQSDISQRFAHRWPGFDDAALALMQARADLVAQRSETIPGPLNVLVQSLIKAAPVSTDAIRLEYTKEPA
jgi:ArsR family transcriptional regulator